MNTKRILTIGNSLANDATRYLDDIVAADPDAELIVGKANLGGCSLEKHWNLVEQCELLGGVKPYDLKIDGMETVLSTLREALVSQPWDYVTLQQVSTMSWRKDTFQPYIGRLRELVRTLAPQARPVIHQTWAYRCDAPLLKEFGIDQKTMFGKLKEAYAEIAAELSCPVVPSGEAFQKARKIFGFQPDKNYDYINPKPLDLPEQSRSLVVGYHWQTGNTSSGKAELHFDVRHGNAKGCYLANAVWFEFFTGRKIKDNRFRPDGVSPDELKILKQVAHETVEEYGGPVK